MKILRIRLKNLNSLRGDHAIDLDAEPLASAGIFAITGATGAGKSTLLDAITLALFGRSARYGTAPNPEDVMSRHTGECRAEVEFEVAQGRFTAAWHLNRARGQPEGKVQPARRFIYDAQGETLAQNITQADLKIVELTGLDYDRFLRSVLLAQGEFARFLKARADERSELLEHLTGTMIYSQLGTLAHEEKTQREQVFAMREQALGNIVILGDGERTHKEQLAAEHGWRLQELAGERNRLLTAIRQGQALSECLAKIAGLKQRHAELDQQTARHHSEFAALALHRKTERFVADLARLDQLTQDLERLEAQAKAATVARDAEALRLAETFEEAGELVSRLKTAKARQIEQTTDDLAAGKSTAEAINAWLGLHQADLNLQTSLPELGQSITALKHHHAEQAALAMRADVLARQLEGACELASKRKADTTRAGDHLAELDVLLQKAQEELIATLAGRTADDLENARAGGQAELEKLQALKAVLARRDESLARQERLAGELASRQPPLDRLGADHESLAIMVRQGSDLVAALHESLRKSQLIANLEQHRAQLSHGDACPLCGALDHPYSKHDVQPATEIERLKAELETASAALQKKQLALQAKAYELAKAEQSATELQRQLEQEQDFRQQLESTLGEHPEEWRSNDGLMQATSGIQKRLQLLDATLRRIRTCESAAATAERNWLNQRHVLETAQGHEKTAADDIERTQTAIQENIEAQERTLSQVQALKESLSAPLSRFGLTPPDEGGEEALIKALSVRRDIALAKERELQQVQSRLQQLEAGLVQLRSEAEELHRQADVLAQEQQAADIPTEIPASAVRQRTRIGWTTLPEAHTALAKARTNLARAQAALGEREQALKEARVTAAASADELTQMLGASEFTDIAALRAARMPEEEAGRVASLEKLLTDQEQQLAGHWQAAQADAEGLRTGDPPQGEALVAAEQSLHALEAEIQTRTAERTLLANELERDIQNRAQMAAARTEIESERAQLAVWRQLAELIGSHDGKKFRVFAQGLSLDVLIRHANRHLQRLAERYRLRRRAGEALDLEIVDLHQASATRPMASLSGGESFLASLALALGLSDLAGRNVRIDSLFIDEGFGSLDADSLDVAIAALEGLRSNQKTVGIISHVDLLKERITTQVQVERGSGGVSSIIVKA